MKQTPGENNRKSPSTLNRTKQQEKKSLGIMLHAEEFNSIPSSLSAHLCLTELVALALRHFSLCLLGRRNRSGRLCPINCKFPRALKVVVGKVLLLLSQPEQEKLLIARQASVPGRGLWAGGTPGCPGQSPAAERELW